MELGPDNLAPPIVLLTGAAQQPGVLVARAVLAAGGKVAAAVPRAWQVDQVRKQLADGEPATANLLVGVVPPRDSEAAAGFVKGATDALGAITHFAGVSMLVREPVKGREPAGDLEELLDANLHSNTTLARAVLPAMRRRQSGQLLFVAGPEHSGQLELSGQCSATCRASTAALAAFAEALADDLTGAGLSVLSFTAPTGSEDSLSPWTSALWSRLPSTH